MSRHNVNLRLTANKGSVRQLNFADVHMLKSAYNSLDIMFIITFPISNAHRRYISYTTIGYKYSFAHEKSKEGDLYIVDNVENGIILSPEGPNFEGRPREN